MAKNLLIRTFYDPLDCEPSGFVTREFIKWWDAYYKQYNRSLDDIIKGATEKTNQIKAAEEAAEKERKEKEAEKEKAEGATKEAHTEKKVRKRKSESSKTTSKKAKPNPKKTTRTSDIPEESIPSGVNLKSASISEKTRPSEIQNQNPPQSEESSKGYSRSPTPENIDGSNAENLEKVSNLEVNNPSSILTNKGTFQKVVPLTPNIPIQPDTNRGIPIDPRVQFQERLEEVRAENVRRVKESVRLLPSILVIDIEADDELEDLLKVISETKAASEHVVSNSENKSVQQLPQSFQPQHQPEKESSSIQQTRNASMQKIILKSTAEKMIALIDQPLETLQKDAY
ncbi:hypothetical protein PIB30_015080 [Stylosanthes scabra]|uniref:Uncharacterized protein n=1 Tax=Stylosanthes scabra TaxID=79078 RepID=A0ABU6Q6T5_9FABA|nr:hypothetical protein [Stylosanthes scabra]